MIINQHRIVQKQIIDRYGKLNPEGENVIYNSLIQILAKNSSIKSIIKKRDNIHIEFNKLSLDKSLIITKLDNEISFKSNKVIININENWKDKLMQLLTKLSKSDE